jgi:hypothetical protein
MQNLLLPDIAIPPDTPAIAKLSYFEKRDGQTAETKKTKHDDGGRA